MCAEAQRCAEATSSCLRSRGCNGVRVSCGFRHVAVDFGKDAGDKIVEVGKEIVHEVVNEMPEAVELGESAHEMVHNMGGVKNMAQIQVIAG